MLHPVNSPPPLATNQTVANKRDGRGGAGRGEGSAADFHPVLLFFSAEWSSLRDGRLGAQGGAGRGHAWMTLPVYANQATLCK